VTYICWFYYVSNTLTDNNIIFYPLDICDPVCEKGLFYCMYLATCNLTCECGITLKFSSLVLLTWHYVGDRLNTWGVMINQMWHFRKALYETPFHRSRLGHIYINACTCASTEQEKFNTKLLYEMPTVKIAPIVYGHQGVRLVIIWSKLLYYTSFKK